MSWMELTASLIRSLAWPIAAVIVVAVLRRQLVGILNRLGSAKVGPVEVIFDRELKEVRQEVEHAQEGTDYPGPKRGTSTLRTDLDRLAEVSPSATILEAFAQVEQVLRSAMADYPDTLKLGASQLARRALGENVISQETNRAIQGLSVMRNLAAHSPERDEVDTERAREFAALADAVIFTIEQDARRPKE